MSELSAYYGNFRFAASVGELHTDRCRGWHLSEVDTWHHCGVCNPKGRNHPEDDREEEIEARNSVGDIFGAGGSIFGATEKTFQLPITTDDDLPF